MSQDVPGTCFFIFFGGGPWLQKELIPTALVINQCTSARYRSLTDFEQVLPSSIGADPEAGPHQPGEVCKNHAKAETQTGTSSGAPEQQRDLTCLCASRSKAPQSTNQNRATVWGLTLPHSDSEAAQLTRPERHRGTFNLPSQTDSTSKWFGCC